jgi:hypothetical protein
MSGYFQLLGIWLFMKACRAYNVIKETIYSNELARTIINEIAYQSQVIYSFVTNQKIESRDPIWLSTCWLCSNRLSEDNGHFFTRTFSNDLFNLENGHYDEYAISYLQAMSKNLVENQKNNPLIIIKTLSLDNQPFYVVRRADTTALKPFVYEQSRFRAISIEYIQMSESIEIKMSREWFITGNELFTPTFVLRMLEYQSQSYLYDNDYKIRIMDSECNIIEFGVGQYLLITKENYEIMDM